MLPSVLVRLVVAQSLEREADAIGRWVPPGLLAAVLLLALYALWRAFERRMNDQDAMLKDAGLKIGELRERLPTLATLEQLGRMGDRFDSRHQQLSDRVAQLEGRKRTPKT